MNASIPRDQDALNYGLLFETAQTQQRLIGASLRQLKAYTHGLDAIVRDQMRRTLVEELGAVAEHSAQAVQALRALEHAARLRFMGWILSLTVLSAAFTALAAWWLLPSTGELAALRVKRERLAASIETLQEQGGLVDLRRCGVEQRWCVRVDRRAPTYGEQADYFVVKGY